MQSQIEQLENRRLLSMTGPVAFGSAMSFGAGGKDRGNDVAVDAAGNSYVTGVYNGSIDLDPGPNSAVLPATAVDGRLPGEVFTLRELALGQSHHRRRAT